MSHRLNRDVNPEEGDNLSNFWWHPLGYSWARGLEVKVQEAKQDVTAGFSLVAHGSSHRGPKSLRILSKLRSYHGVRTQSRE